MLGGTGGGPFRTASASGQPVVGFRYGLGSWAGKSAIQYLTPLHNRNGSGTAAQEILARDGYAVGAIHVAADNLVRAVQIEFMRLTAAGQLNTADSYRSEWIGTPGDADPEKLGGSGNLVIGIFGRRAAVMDGIGLVMKTGED
jgi:hypothetical protein